LCRTLRPEDGRARPKHVVTIGNKIQNQDSCVFRRTPTPSFDLHKHNGDDEPEDHLLVILNIIYFCLHVVMLYHLYILYNIR
jgi:hypothetical protein